ncbi:MAG: hypothetical protein IJS86_01100 [Lachnospiraceae bacterium]|nr:hypothetical protein [Lachnospiraceae bacterium]
MPVRFYYNKNVLCGRQEWKGGKKMAEINRNEITAEMVDSCAFKCSTLKDC